MGSLGVDFGPARLRLVSELILALAGYSKAKT